MLSHILVLATSSGGATWARAGDAPPLTRGAPDDEPSAAPRGAASAPWRATLDGGLVTDRPDFTESTDAVARGHFQFENGYTFTYDREKARRIRDHTAPEALLRAGVFAHTELRLAWPGYSWSSSLFETQTRRGRTVLVEDQAQGAGDLSLGFKYKFFEQQGLRPHLGIIGEVSVPSESASVSAGDAEPGVKLLWAYNLGDRFSLSGNVNFVVPNDAGDRFLQTAASLSLGVDLTASVGAYAEYFGFYPDAEHEDAAHTLNGGMTFAIGENVQLDWRTGFGLNEQADDFFAGVGLSWRW